MMIDTVILTKRAEKHLLRCPMHIVSKFKYWVALVESEGLETVRRIRGFHDEPLMGKRLGQRSIRLNQAYRAVYIIRSNNTIEFAEIKEIHKHEY